MLFVTIFPTLGPFRLRLHWLSAAMALKPSLQQFDRVHAQSIGR